jgi:beta-N-acetylhexosaminidase
VTKKLFLVLLFSFLLLIINASCVTTNQVGLKKKIGQMLIIGFKGSELHSHDAIVKAILAQNIGGIILFDYDFQTKTFEHNIKNPQQLKHLTQQLQEYASKAAENHNNNLTPLLISIDYEGGYVTRLTEDKGFPKTKSAAEIGKSSFQEAEQEAKKMVKVLQKEGINMNFTPVLDVNINSENPIIGKSERSYSFLPEKIVDYGAIFSKVYHDNGVLCVYKHFPGRGSSTGDTHVGFVDVTKTWKEEELYPYKKLLKQAYHCPMVMIGHVVHYGLDKKGYPASLSYSITTKLLRHKMKFNGVIVSDDLQMKAITENYNLRDAVRLAVNAGEDILVFGNQLVPTVQDPQKIVDMIYDDVKTGKIPEHRINESYQRIMKLKKQLREMNK